MSDQVDPAASDVSEQPEPETTGTEQPKTESTSSFASELLKVAADDGHQIGDAPLPKVEDKPEPEPEAEATEEATQTATDDTQDAESETVDDDKSDEEKVATKKGDEWPESAKARVAEESAKRRRANERAERAEALAEQLKSQLNQAVAPTPTEDDPFKDITDPVALDRLERSYEKSLDLAEEDPDALVAQYVDIEKKKSGVDLLEKFTPEQLLAITKRKAERAIRKQIPERRTYLQQRAIADAEAAKRYPELQDPNTDFYKATAILANNLITGRAMKEPDVLIWIARAVKEYQRELQEQNGNGAVKSPEAKKIVTAARQKVAPTPTRTRSFVERGSSSVNLEKAKTKLEEQGTPEAAEEVVAALLSGSGSSKRLEPIAE